MLNLKDKPLKINTFYLPIILFFNTLPTTAQSLKSYKHNIDGTICTAYSRDITSQKPLLILIHGSPGDHRGWVNYLTDNELNIKFRLLALDRPGFGSSDSTRAYPSLDFQAKFIQTLINQYAQGQKVYLLGHSVGCAVIMKLLTTAPKPVDAVILLAPVIAAEYEQPRWYNKLAKYDWVNKKLSKDMQTSQAEMMAIPAQLEAIEPLLKNIKTPIYLFHGRLDMIAPYGNAELLREEIPKSMLFFKSYPFNNHFIPWSKFKDIKVVLLKL